MSLTTEAVVAGPIDWEHPPSTRVRPRPPGPRLVLDAVVLVVCGTLLWILAGALRGDAGVSASGVRAYLVDGLGGSRFLLWGVTGVVALAALYVLIDGLFGVRTAVRARRRGGRG